VLVTCEGKHKEGQAVRELFNMLNEVRRLPPPPPPPPAR
jgi:hypothetical protein